MLSAVLCLLLFGHVSACGADHMCSDAALLCSDAALLCSDAALLCSDAALLCSDAGAVGWACPWGVDCLDVLKPKAVDWAS